MHHEKNILKWFYASRVCFHGSVGSTSEVLPWAHSYCSSARYLASFQWHKSLHKPWFPRLSFTQTFLIKLWFFQVLCSAFLFLLASPSTWLTAARKIHVRTWMSGMPGNFLYKVNWNVTSNSIHSPHEILRHRQNVHNFFANVPHWWPVV